MSIVLLGYNDSQIETTKAKDGGVISSDKYYIGNREKAEAAYTAAKWEMLYLK